MRVGQKRRRDANEIAIVRALRKTGVSVRQISGAGVPDLLTQCRFIDHATMLQLILRFGFWLPIEVKEPHGTLSLPQQRYHAEAPFPIVESIDDALQLLGIIECDTRQICD